MGLVLENVHYTTFVSHDLGVVAAALTVFDLRSVAVRNLSSTEKWPANPLLCSSVF